jgi:hypothetical protein
MTPDDITRLFKEAYDTFPPLEGKQFNDDLLVSVLCYWYGIRVTLGNGIRYTN